MRKRYYDNQLIVVFDMVLKMVSFMLESYIHQNINIRGDDSYLMSDDTMKSLLITR